MNVTQQKVISCSYFDLVQVHYVKDVCISCTQSQTSLLLLSASTSAYLSLFFLSFPLFSSIFITFKSTCTLVLIIATETFISSMSLTDVIATVITILTKGCDESWCLSRAACCCLRVGICFLMLKSILKTCHIASIHR